MTSIPNNAFVYTFALLCHGAILYSDSRFIHNARIITPNQVELGCPIYFSSIDVVMRKLHDDFHKRIENTTKDIIENHKNFRAFSLFYDKILHFNPNSISETIHRTFNIDNTKYEDGIYLFSIHKKTDAGLENIPIGDPLNLMYPESWSILDNIFKTKTKLESSMMLDQEFSRIAEKYNTKKGQLISVGMKDDGQKSIGQVLDTQMIQDKRNVTSKFKLHMDSYENKERIIQIKLSAIIELLSMYNPKNKENMNFFNIYDFTCNGFSSMIVEKERKELVEKFKDLDISMQILYGGRGCGRTFRRRFATQNKKKTRRYV